MNNINLQNLIKMKDRIPFLYLDRCKIVCKNDNICVFKDGEKFFVPVQKVMNFILGTNCSISTPAIFLMYKSNSHIHFAKRDGLYYYTPAIGSTYDNKNAEQHSFCFHNQKMKIIEKMLFLRFNEDFNVSSVEQARGIEGSRIRTFYQNISKKHSIDWGGRKFGEKVDKLNNFITLSNTFLYSISTTVIHSLDYLTDLGFLHTGQRMSFVFDFADIFKFKFFIPMCFETHINKGEKQDLEINFRDVIKKENIIDKMINVLDFLFWEIKIDADWNHIKN